MSLLARPLKVALLGSLLLIGEVSIAQNVARTQPARQLKTAEQFLGELRRVKSFSFGGTLSEPGKEKDGRRLLRAYYPVLHTAGALVKDPSLADSIKTFVSELGVPHDMKPLLARAIDLQPKDMAVTPKVRAFTSRGRAAMPPGELPSSELDHASLTSTQIHAFMQAHDPAVFQISDGTLKLLINEYGSFKDINARAGGSATSAWHIGLMSAWERALVLGLANNQGVAEHIEALPTAMLNDDKVMHAVARLVRRSGLQFSLIPVDSMSITVQSRGGFAAASTKLDRLEMGALAPLPVRHNHSFGTGPIGHEHEQDHYKFLKTHNPAAYSVNDVFLLKWIGENKSFLPTDFDHDFPHPGAVQMVARMVELGSRTMREKNANWLRQGIADPRYAQDAYVMPLARLAMACGVRLEAVKIRLQSGAWLTLADHPDIRAIRDKLVLNAQQTMHKVLARFDGSAPPRVLVGELAQLLSSGYGVEVTDVIARAQEHLAEGRLQRIEWKALSAAEQDKLVGALTADQHLGVTAVMSALFVDGGHAEIGKALVAQGFAKEQVKTWLDQAHDLAKLKPEQRRFVLADLVHNDAPGFALMPLRLKLVRDGRLSEAEMATVFAESVRHDAVGVVEVLLDHAKLSAASEAERIVLAKFLSDRVADGTLPVDAFKAALADRRYFTFSVELERDLKSAVATVVAAKGAQRAAATKALADVLEKHAAIVDGADLMVDALQQIHAAGLQLVMPLDEADGKLGGVAARKAPKAAEQGGAGGVVVGGIQLAMNDSPDKDVAAVPRASASELVMTPTTEANLRAISIKWKLGKPVLLEGPTSAGKTSAIRYMAHKTGSPYRRINLSYHTDVSDLIGRFIGGENKYTEADLAKKSEVELHALAEEYGLEDGLDRAAQRKAIHAAQHKPRWVDGPLVRAMKKGEVLLLDEMNLARSEVLERLNSLFDDDHELRLTEHRNEVVRPHPNFRLFATQNPARYAGRARLSDAMLSRWTRIHCQGLSTKDLTTILKAKYGAQIPDEELAKLITAHDALSRAADDGQIGSASGGVAFSLRNLERVAQRFVRYRGGALSDAALMRRETEEIYRGGLPEPEDVQAVHDILTAAMPHQGPGFYDGLEVTENDHALMIGDVVLRKLHTGHGDVPGKQARLVLTQRTKEILYRVAKALDNGENPLLVGDRASGKTAIAKLLAHYLGQPYYRQIISGSTDAMELVGGYDNRGWKDGPLLVAGRPDGAGGLLLLDELNLGSSALLERLNPVLDDERKIVLAEKEGENIRMHPDFHFVAAMNPPNNRYAGRKKLSVAIQNRMTSIFVPELAERDEQALIMTELARDKKVPATVAHALVDLHHWVTASYKDGTLGKDLREDDRPVLSIRQLRNALDTVAAFSDGGHYGNAFLRAVETEYGSSANAADNAAILKKADELAQ